MDINKARVLDSNQRPYKAVVLDYEYIFGLGTDRNCYALNDREITLIISVLDMYRWRTRWSGDAVDLNEIDALVSGIINQLMSVSEECGGMTQFRFVDCVLEYSNDGENWTPVDGWPEGAGACFAGADGQPGADGCTPLVGADFDEDGKFYLQVDTDCDSVPDQYIDLTTPLIGQLSQIPPNFPGRCDSAVGMAKRWIRETWFPMLNAIYVAESLNDAKQACYDIWQFPPNPTDNTLLDILIEQLYGVISLADVGTWAENGSNEDWLLGHVYYSLGENGRYSETVHSVLLDRLSNCEFNTLTQNQCGQAMYIAHNHEPELFYRFMQLAWADYPPSDCTQIADPGCNPGEWSHQFDFETGLHDWVVGGDAHWDNGVGVTVGGFAGTIGDVLTIEVPQCTVTAFDVCYYSSEFGNGTGTTTLKVANPTQTNLANHTGDLDVGLECWSPTFDPTSGVVQFLVWVQTYYGGEITIKSITLTGTGDDPFV